LSAAAHLLFHICCCTSAVSDPEVVLLLSAILLLLLLLPPMQALAPQITSQGASCWTVTSRTPSTASPAPAPSLHSKPCSALLRKRAPCWQQQHLALLQCKRARLQALLHSVQALQMQQM
jgi:hypothetical protein